MLIISTGGILLVTREAKISEYVAKTNVILAYSTLTLIIFLAKDQVTWTFFSLRV